MPRFRPVPELTFQSLDGEVVAIHFGRGTYYSLRGASAPAFEAVAAGMETDRLDRIFLHPPAEAEASLQTLVAAWVADGLLSPAPDDAPPVEATGALGHPWSEPRYEAFTDMQQLLLADPIHDVGPGAWPAPQS